MKNRTNYKRKKNSGKNLKNLLLLKKEQNKKRKFKYYDYIAGLEEEVSFFGYEERDITAYRILNPPPTPDDFVPQVFMPERADAPVYHSPENLKNLPTEKKRRRLSESGLSFFDTPLHAQQAARNRDERIASRVTPEERMAKRRQFGDRVVKLYISKIDGMSTLPDEHGHINFLPYENAQLEKRVDLSFEHIITYEDDE
jgi:hypothetical protein